MPKEEKEQEIEILFESTMKESFPKLAKEIGIQEVQEVKKRQERNIQSKAGGKMAAR